MDSRYVKFLGICNYGGPNCAAVMSADARRTAAYLHRYHAFEFVLKTQWSKSEIRKYLVNLQRAAQEEYGYDREVCMTFYIGYDDGKDRIAKVEFRVV